MIKIKPFLIATLLLTGFALPAVAQIGEARNNLSVGINGGVNLNSASFTPTIKQNSLMGITGGLTARYISEKYFAMICGAQVELNVSQRGWDQLFETISLDANGYEVTSKDPTKTYTRKMTYRYSFPRSPCFRTRQRIAILCPCRSSNQLSNQ